MKIFKILFFVSLIVLSAYKPISETLAQPEKPYIIVIDPGHGGFDTGAESIVKEVDVCDKTSEYLFSLLESDPDFMPILTRDKNTCPKISQRADFANNANADFVLSVHANSDSSKSSKGFECFPKPPGRKYHEESLEFAKILVSNMREAGHKIRGNENKSGIKYAYYRGGAKKIVDSDDDKVRKEVTFGILEKTDCPAILIEQCFITNYEDTENWASDEGCRKSAEIYYKSIKQFFHTSEKA